MVEDVVAPIRCRNSVGHAVGRVECQWRETSCQGDAVRVDRRPHAAELLAIEVDRYDSERRFRVCGRRGSHREDNVCISLEREGSRSAPTICNSSAEGSDVCPHNVVISIIIGGFGITVSYYCPVPFWGGNGSCASGDRVLAILLYVANRTRMIVRDVSTTRKG